MTPEQVNAALVADLAKFDWEIACEACGAPLFDGDDFVSDPDGVSGCWASMTDLPSKRERPCFAYRVGKASAAQGIDARQGHDPKGHGAKHESPVAKPCAHPFTPES